MTIYNWRREGLHPRLLGVGQPRRDRRWYISEFVWDTWESKRKKGKRPSSRRLTRCRRARSLKRKKGLSLCWKMDSQQGAANPAQGLSSRLEPETWPLILLGDGPLRPEVDGFSKKSGTRGVRLLGFVSEEERIRRTREAKWMVTPPHTREDLGLTPLEARSVGVPCTVSMDGGSPGDRGPHALRCEPGKRGVS